MTYCQLAGPLFHQSRVDLRALMPDAAQVLVYSSQMYSQLICHRLIGSPRSIGDERHSYLVLTEG